MVACNLMLLAIVTIGLFTIPSEGGVRKRVSKWICKEKCCQKEMCEMDCQNKYSKADDNDNNVGVTGLCKEGDQGRGCYCTFMHSDDLEHVDTAFQYGDDPKARNLVCKPGVCKSNCVFQFPVSQHPGQSTGRQVSQGECDAIDSGNKCTCIVHVSGDHWIHIVRENYGYFDHRRH